MDEIRFACDDYDENIARLERDRPLTHIGLRRMDDRLGGLRPRLILVAALPGCGKTTLLHQIADDVACAGLPALMFSQEVPAAQLMLNSIVRGSRGQLDKREFADGIAPLMDDERFLCASERYLRDVAPNVAVFEERMGVSEIGHVVETCIRQRGQRCVVFVDYIQILPPLAGEASVDERRDIARNVEELRALVKRYEIPVIAVSSVSRQYYSRLASLDALGGSSALEYSADSVILLAAEGKDVDEQARNGMLSERPLTARIAKNRYGACGEVRLLFNAQHAVFTERDDG